MSDSRPETSCFIYRSSDTILCQTRQGALLCKAAPGLHVGQWYLEVHQPPLIVWSGVAPKPVKASLRPAGQVPGRAEEPRGLGGGHGRSAAVSGGGGCAAPRRAGGGFGAAARASARVGCLMTIFLQKCSLYGVIDRRGHAKESSPEPNREPPTFIRDCNTGLAPGSSGCIYTHLDTADSA